MFAEPSRDFANFLAIAFGQTCDYRDSESPSYDGIASLIEAALFWVRGFIQCSLSLSAQ
jgi:hypothetical protein